MGRDAITGLVVLATSLFLFWATLGLERHPLVPVGPEFYPRLVLGTTAFLALLLVVSDVIAHRRARVATAPAESTAGPTTRWSSSLSRSSRSTLSRCPISDFALRLSRF